MRQYKFRGKALHDIEKMYFDENEPLLVKKDDWLYGSLIYNDGRPYIVGTVIESDSEYIVLEYWYSVDPKTVGQYTGLKDTNGREIYDGDLCWDDHNECYGVVKFDEGKFVYEWENICEDLWEAKDDIEIIGNIHDNPELLKEVNKHEN